MPEVADATIGIHFRGNTLPAEARAEALKAGAAAGDGFQDSFAQKLKNFATSLRPTFQSAGDHAGETFSGRFLSKVNGLAERMKLRAPFARAGERAGGAFGGAFDGALGRIGTNFRLGLDDMDASVNRLISGIKGLELPGKRFFERWKTLPHGFRQFSFYTALFAALGESIAVLGSAAGSSLAVLGTTALAAGLGIGVMVAGMIGMNGELADIAPAARPAALALREMGKRFSEIRQTIQGRLFQGLEGPIRELTNKLLPRLEDGFGKTADTMNGFFRDLSSSLTTPKSLERMSALLDGMQPILRNLGDVVIRLGGSLARVFEAALPSAQAFTESMSNGLGRFNAFLDSAEGQQALTDFFGTLDRVMGALGPLIAETGKMLAGLVTEDSIRRFETTIGLLTRFMDPLGGILRAIGALDPIGIIAQALSEIGDALGPVIPQLEALGGTVGDNIKTVFTVVGDILENLAGQAIPALAGFFEKLQPGLEAFLGLVADENTTSNGEGLVEMLEGLGTAISELIQFAVDANEALAPVSDTLNTWSDAFNNAGSALGGFLRNEEQATDDFNSSVNDFFAGILESVNTWATGVKDGIRSAWEGGVTAISEWATGVNTTVNTVINDTITAVANWGLGILTSINTFTSGALAAFSQWGTDVWTSIVTFATNTTSTIAGWVGNVVGFFVGFAATVTGVVSGWVGNIIGFFSRLVSTVIGVVSGWVANVIGFFSRLASTVTGVISGWVGNVIGFFSRLVSTVVGVVSGFVNNVVNFFTTMVSRAGAVVGGIVGTVSGVFGRMVSTVVGIVSGFVNTVVGFFQGLPGRIGSAISGVTSAVAGVFSGLAGFARSAVEGLIAPFRGVGDRIRAAIGSIGNVLGGIKLPFTANGGVFAGAQTRIIGEAGPEAVVPLRRNLSLVDPSVRALSAFAQGKDPSAFAGESTQNSTIVESGAIRIYTTNSDPYTTATAVLDRIVTKL